ncbi:MAG: HAD family hydrolase [Candidatus Falkowbacteria bacterium]|nr:MAG: HAD family hydrolase [Candidatus Falkowbacteria bacterium]
MDLENKKFFIFDLDGVLVDSTRLSCQKVEMILDRLGLPTIPRSFLIKHWGKKMSDIFDLIGEVLDASKDQISLMNKMEPEISLELPYKFPRETFEALLNLRLYDRYLGLLTSRSNASLQQVSSQTGMPLTVFHKIQTTDHWPHHKPSGRAFGPFANWAYAQKLKPERLVYFGDTISQDLVATQNYEYPIDFVGVVSGVNTREEFLAAGVPDCRIVDFEKLPEFLHQIMRTAKSWTSENFQTSSIRL